MILLSVLYIQFAVVTIACMSTALALKRRGASQSCCNMLIAVLEVSSRLCTCADRTNTVTNTHV
jgi:hypothetical protein